MMGSILQMRKGQLQCNAKSQWSYYVYIASDKSGMMLSVFMTLHPAFSKAVVKPALRSECVCFSAMRKQTNTEKDASLNAEEKQHDQFINFKLIEYSVFVCTHMRDHRWYTNKST